MNPQLRTLKDKIWAEEYWTNPNTDKLLPAQLNRFAELIVAECCQVLSKETIRHDGYGYNQHALYQKIREHFGVQE